ncbi:MAG: OPT/YSL family transporter, partial [Streptosporangiaceae bacterium]
MADTAVGMLMPWRRPLALASLCTLLFLTFLDNTVVSVALASIQSDLHGGLPWNMIIIGMVMATLVIILDIQLERRGSSFRAPVLAIAIGVYLPFELSVPIMVGGVVS